VVLVSDERESSEFYSVSPFFPCSLLSLFSPRDSVPDVGGAFVLFFAKLPSNFNVFPTVLRAREGEERKSQPEGEKKENDEALSRSSLELSRSKRSGTDFSSLHRNGALRLSGTDKRFVPPLPPTAFSCFSASELDGALPFLPLPFRLDSTEGLVDSGEARRACWRLNEAAVLDILKGGGKSSCWVRMMVVLSRC
jgi:hypothetical protein